MPLCHDALLHTGLVKKVDGPRQSLMRSLSSQCIITALGVTLWLLKRLMQRPDRAWQGILYIELCTNL